MSISSDHKALLFLGAIGVLGAGVRVVRASSAHPSGEQPALERQMQAADSASRVAKGKLAGKSKARVQRVVAAPVPSRPRINGKLDLDVATAAELDSLPGISVTLAKRIVADRMAHGPFTSAQGLRRVDGVSKRLIERLDTLVRFSGTYAAPNPGDTVLPPKSRSRKR